MIEEKHLSNCNTCISYNNKNPQKLYGRHNEIHDLLKFISGKDEDADKKIYFIHDEENRASFEISMFCFKYAHDRNLSQKESYYIDMNNQNSSESIHRTLVTKMTLIDDKIDLVEKFKNKRLLLLIDNCDDIIS